MRTDEVETNSNLQIKYGALISYIAIAINIIAGILYTPWLIHHIGSGNYGLYTIAISLISMFVMDFGISTAIIKYITQYRAEGKHEKIDQIINVSIQLYLIIDAVILLVLVVVYFFIGIIYGKLTPYEIVKFKTVYIIVACANVITFPFIPLSGILTSYEKFINLNICDIINKVLTVTLTILAICAGYGLYALVTINALVNLLIIIIKLIMVRKNVSLHINIFYHNKEILKEIFNFSVWVTIMIVTQRFIFNLTPSIIGAIVGSVAAAVFGIASTLEGYSFSIGNVLSSMFMPKISRILTGDNIKNELTNLMIKMGRIQLYILGLILIGLISVGMDFIIRWMGNDYSLAYYCSVLLITPNLFIWPMMIAATALTVVNRVKEHAIVNVCMAIINIVLELLLVPKYGIIGAAVSIAIAYCFRAVAMLYLYKRFLNIRLGDFLKHTYLKLSFPMFLSLTICYMECYFIIAKSWFMIGLECIAVTISFTIIMYLFALNISEKGWVKNKLHKFRE